MSDSGQSAVAIEAAVTQKEVVEAILRMEAPAGLMVSVVGLDTSDQVQVAWEIISDLPGWQPVVLSALPWERDVPHALTSVLQQRGVGDLDVPGASTVVVLRDALWADKESFRSMVGTVRKMIHGRLVIILTGVRAERSEGADGTAPEGLRPPWAPETLRGLIDSEVHLRPLELDEIQSLAMDETGMRLSPGTVSRLRDATGGWPGRVRDVLRGMPPDHWAEQQPTVPLPDQWYRRYHNSTADLGPDVLTLLTALSIFRTGCDMPLLRALAGTVPGRPEDDGWFDRALSDSLAEGLVQLTPGAVSPRLSLARPTDRAVIRALTAPDVSAVLHRSAADYAVTTGDTDAAVSHRSVARVFDGHHDSAPLAEHGTELAAEGQWVRAASMFVLASEIELDRPRSVELLLSGLDAFAFAGDIREARWRIADLHQMMDSGQLNSLRGYVAFHEGRRRQAKGLLDRARESLTSVEEQGVLASRMVQFNLADWDMEAIVSWSRRAVDALPVESGARQESDAIAIIGRAALDGRLPDDTAGNEGQLRAQSREIAEGWVSLALDDPIGARERLHTRPQIEGSARISQWRDAWLARTCLVLGDLATASTLVDGALTRAHHYRIELHVPLLLWTGVMVAALRGETEKFRGLLRRLTVGPDAFAVQRLPAEMTRLFAGGFTGDLEAAVHAGRELAQISETTELQPGFWPWEDVHALNLVHTGAFDEAEQFLEGAETAARESGLSSLQAKLMVPRALLVLRSGDTEDGIRVFDDAVALISSLGVPLYESQVLYEYGQALRRLGRRRVADDVLRRAAEVFAAMGATEMVRRCERERRASGLGPRVAPGQLSDQEHEIAGAVLRGSSNRDIAAELFLSQKTVEYHLTRMYRKLGVTNRRELVALFAGQDSGTISPG